MSEYKISRFTLVEPLSGNGLGLFNTLTRALGGLPAEVWNTATSGQDQDTAEELAVQGFLVDRDQDEDQVLAHWRTSMAYDLTTLTYLVSPTRACNMACSYCIHGSRKRSEHMSSETARAVLDFIQADVEIKRPKTVRLDFGGAEAILNPNVMVYLAEGLYRFCRGRGLEFKVSLISNGLALTPDLIKELKKFGLVKVRVTVSGVAETHDRLRPAKDGGPTYDRIMGNLAALAGLVEIGLQGQYDPGNGDYRTFPKLLDELTDKGLRDHLSDVSFGPFLPVGNDAQLWDDPPTGPIDCLVEEDPRRYLWLQEQIRQRGFKEVSGPPVSRCLANYRNNVIIDVAGGLGVCPSMMDHTELNYGQVRTGVDFRLEARLLVRNLPDFCRQECCLAPLCDGGCR
ncbi:MAG: radical SAM protein [Deltaproteobacteria bacterium]|nr:radical SAM protein [Deltaproteobacteria bacterium]